MHDQKYQKSARRTRAVLLPNHRRRARVSRASHAWQVRAAKNKEKVGGLADLHIFSYTTRANISHEIAEQIRARIVCTPAESAWRGLTHMRSMCVGVAETGVGAYDDPLLSRGEHCSPAKKHKDTFLFWYFCVTKSTKSHQRERSPLFENSSRVHELVARAMRGKCVRQGSMAKIGSFVFPTVSAIPRVRTYHTKKPSRFVHALPARPHIKVWRAWIEFVR